MLPERYEHLASVLEDAGFAVVLLKSRMLRNEFVWSAYGSDCFVDMAILFLVEDPVAYMRREIGA